MVKEFLPQTPEHHAATTYVRQGPYKGRPPESGKLELSVRRREHKAFLAGLQWERERWLAAMAAELTRVSRVEYPARDIVEHYLGEVRTRLGVLDRVRCPHGHALEDLRSGASECSAGCR